MICQTLGENLEIQSLIRNRSISAEQLRTLKQSGPISPAMESHDDGIVQPATQGRLEFPDGFQRRVQDFLQ